MALEQAKNGKKKYVRWPKLQKKKSFMLKKDLASTSQTNEKVRSCAARQVTPKNKIPTTTYFTESFKSIDIFSSWFTLFLSLTYNIYPTPPHLFCLTNKPKKRNQIISFMIAVIFFFALDIE